ncbi:MAG: DUF4338 domain-containing protein [Ardenticatenaceae bacterium]|nr:DUF4338 domain-containing protein [Ardenticatenaceae bacterium]MCB9442709.1 DUF4338 domain-containing protein [Ardenticatenaceae bacterium]
MPTDKSVENQSNQNTQPIILNNEQESIPTAEELRALVFDELETLGLRINGKSLEPVQNTKEFKRGVHAPAREILLSDASNWITYAWEKYSEYFASGREIEPKLITPELIEVTTKQQKELFRLARYTWSLPYTKGYGRRLQYLVMDGANGKLIGILGLQSPPLSFPARDRLFSYPEGKKTELVNQTMDIYTLGAIPPYSRLLGGKLIALTASSNELRDAYRRKYSDQITEMEGRKLPANLVALTTTSAYGRSSIYNRLRFKDAVEFRSLDYTEGYGAFHLERLYPTFRQFLEAQDISTCGGFGKGPRIKWQTMVRALRIIGFDSKLLHHGIKREAFLIPLIRNIKNFMEGIEPVPDYIDVPFETLSEFWRERWLIPRSERVDGWSSWSPEEIKYTLFNGSL